MNEADFLEKREPHWKRLSQLCGKGETTLKSLSSAELVEFFRLYRATSRDLSMLQAESSNFELVEFLNSLVARAYGILYRSPAKSFSTVVKDALLIGAQSVRKLRWAIFASFLIFVSGAMTSVLVLSSRPDLRHHIISDDEEGLFSHWKQAEFEDRTGAEQAQYWSFYATNNPMVTIRTVAMSAGTFGFFAGFMEFMTGRQLGALAYDMNSVGKLGFLVTSLMPHGASELSGIILAGGAGLWMGWAMICPGRRSRTEALTESGKDALAVFLMAVLMMFIAAPFEGFFSFSPDYPQWLKAMVGIVAFGAWMMYWVGYGRKESQPEN